MNPCLKNTGWLNCHSRQQQRNESKSNKSFVEPAAEESKEGNQVRAHSSC
jgi:hypothetical protein